MKKKILISSNSRTFIQIFGSFIPKLAEEFSIFIILTVLEGVKAPSTIMRNLSSWKEDGTIVCYDLVPDPKSGLKFHLYMRKKVKVLRSYNFDVWLTRDEMQLDSRYILECALPTHCLCVAFWPLLTYLLQRYQYLVKQLLAGSKMDKYLLDIGKKVVGAEIMGYRGNVSIVKRYLKYLAKKLEESASFAGFLKRLMAVAFGKCRVYLRRYKHYWIDRIILPCLMVGKRFTFEPYDQMTQMGSGRIDGYIFCDELEVEAHKRLFKTPNIFLAQYPTQDKCRCRVNSEDKTTVLCPLSGWEGNSLIPEDTLHLYARDIQTVFRETNATNVHLRRHPDFGDNGGWAVQLMNYLREQGVDAKIVGCDQAIGEVACNYLCVASFASAALREVRASCNEVIVIGFMGVSSYYFSNPKLVFGMSEGIGWIEEDGSYDPSVFRCKYHMKERKSVVDIVLDLSRTQAP